MLDRIIKCGMISGMRFINREEELSRLERLSRRRDGGLAVIHGRRRVGKTRLLLEWSRLSKGLYTVADRSSPDIQRRHLAEALALRIDGFAEVTYPDWAALFSRLAREAKALRWRGPLVLDELPYLVEVSPELPSVLQRFIDHDAAEARLVVAIAGSSQRMMQGLVLDAGAPLFGRARELLHITPLEPRHLSAAFKLRKAADVVPLHVAWGGIPRYWELALDHGDELNRCIDALVLDPLGPLHDEPSRLLIEEMPPAVELRPVLDAIGAGVHRLSEIAGRIGRPATSLARPLSRLVDMELVRREVPFGESERRSKRSLYTMADPFFRLWFRLVAPNRAFLATATRTARLGLLEKAWPQLHGAAWEELCRRAVPRLSPDRALGSLGPWGPAGRWWRGNAAEWDVVAESTDGTRLLVGEVKARTGTITRAWLQRKVRELLAKPLPELPGQFAGHERIRALFVPSVPPRMQLEIEGVRVVTAADLLSD